MLFIKAESLQLLLTQPRRIMHFARCSRIFGASTAWPCTQYFFVVEFTSHFLDFLVSLWFFMDYGFRICFEEMYDIICDKEFLFCVASCFYITFARIYICSSTNNSNFFSFLAGWIILKSSLNSQRNGIMMMIFV